jgi:hypothetical protein
LEGRRHSVIGAGGVSIGLLTSGVGPGLLLVHGGMSQIEAWEPAWDLLSKSYNRMLWTAVRKKAAYLPG